jgi:ribosomal protein S18 acetylase RimI-like enzyme
MTTPPSLEWRAAAVKSGLSGIDWPALPIGPNATLLAVMFQLEQSQWWPPEKLAAAQESQLLAVLRHAAKTVPFQARRLREAGVPLVPPVAGGRVVGLGSFIVLSPTEAEGASFAIAPEFRGMSVGSLLVVAGRKEMYARGIRKVRSETDRPENVNWLTKRFGYRIVGKVAKRHSFGDREITYWTQLEADLEPPF